ncbi:MAG TPA: TIGR03790 family protein [Gemmataceae bacterium]|nr:TIGR03790 family protein [Gemmataceae bacterium]
MRCLSSLLALACLLMFAQSSRALGPEDVYLLVNKNVPASRTIAEHYCEKRGVPRDHILSFDLPATEDVSRVVYEDRLAAPLRKQLKDRRDKIKVLLSIYGIPLRVGPASPNVEEKAELDKVRKEIEPLRKQHRELQETIKGLADKIKKDPKSPDKQELETRKKERSTREAKLQALDQRVRWLSHSESQAAVDSELALLWHTGFDLRRWQLNLLYWQVPEEARKGKPPVIMTARLDGPSAELVNKLVDKAMEVEAKGLRGKVYVDAKGNRYDPKQDGGFGYGGYDESLREMAKLLEKEAKLTVTLDDKPELFAVGYCTDCALYCGWYSHAKFVDCCRFVPGAVAYHIASSEAVSLRNAKATYWCKNQLEKGAIATLGPVAEPYTLGFPKPAEFFGFLVTGHYTLVECYWRTEMMASWMTVLVGDPLYNPYAKNPRLKPEQVKSSPAGATFKVIRGGK